MKRLMQTGPVFKLVTFSFLTVFWFTGCSNEKAGVKAPEAAARQAAAPGKPATAEARSPRSQIQELARMPEFTTSRKFVSFSAQSLAAWKKQVPEIQDITITSSLDQQKEPALFYDSGSEAAKPLLVVLHSWSDRYLQEASIPFALWAKKYDWVFIQPNYRGVFERPEATGSDLAIQDILDAVDYAKQHARVDASRIYVTGASGGGMGSLLAAGRHPEIWAGVAAWVPVADITSWYQYNRQNFPGRKYIRQIEASVGGNPLQNAAAGEESKKRSALTYLENAKEVPVYIAHGIKDRLVPPDHALRAYNLLAKPKDRIREEQITYIVKHQAVPQDLKSSEAESFFGQPDPKVHLVKKSANVTLVLFEGVHDLVYNPTLLWLNQQQRR